MSTPTNRKPNGPAILFFIIGIVLGLFWIANRVRSSDTKSIPVVQVSTTPTPKATRFETAKPDSAEIQSATDDSQCTDAKANKDGCFLELPSSGEWTDKFCLTQGHMPGDYILDTHEVSGCVKMALYRSRSDQSPAITEDCAGQASLNDKTLGSYPMCVTFARSSGDQVRVQWSSANTFAHIFR